MRNFHLHIWVEGQVQLVPFRKTGVPPESVVIIRTSFIEMKLFPSQLLPETTEGAEHSPLWVVRPSLWGRTGSQDSGRYPSFGRD